MRKLFLILKKTGAIFLYCLFFVLLFNFNATAAFASDVDGTIDAVNKWAWSENVGWINFGTLGGDVHITDAGMTGYAWIANYGWVNLNPLTAGVTIDDDGYLSGYAWGENTGWINFNGARINDSGFFLGYASGAVTGDISFNCVNTSSCGVSDFKVQTDYRYLCARTTCDTGGGPETIYYQCNNGIDDDGDGLADYASDPGCSSSTDDSEAPRNCNNNGFCEAWENTETCPLDCPALPQCSDGIDNDGDNLIDYPADSGCANANDNEESPQNCNNNSICEPWETNAACPADCPVLPFCGDGICRENETCLSCPADCGECPLEPICGDDICNGAETCATCPGDCGICPPPEPICGDNVCNGSETCAICPDDCGECPPEIEPICGDGICNGDETCSNCETDCGTCPVPEPPACSDGRDNDRDGLIDMNDPGCSAADDEDEFNEPEVMTQCSDGADNDGDGLVDYPRDPGCGSMADNNETDEKIYSRCADSIDNDHDGLVDYPTDPGCLSIYDNDETDEELLPVATVDRRTTIVNQVEGVARSLLQITLDNRLLEKANEAARTPAIIITVAASAAAVATLGLTGINLLTYLYFLLTQPLAFFAARRNKRWGVVYNSITKKPVDLAVVRVLSSPSRTLVRTLVTDKQGRFFAVLNPGRYLLVVEKQDYHFPSGVMAGKTSDDRYGHIYHGEEIAVTAKDAVAVAIPLDPAVRPQNAKRLLFVSKMRRTQLYVGLLGPAMAAVSFVIRPSWWVGAACAAQLVVYFIIRRLAVGEKPKSWGMVRDTGSAKGVKQAIVRVFDTKFHKLLDSQVTDGAGRYGFLVGNDEYYLTVEKAGYLTKRTEIIDLRGKRSGYLAEEVKLHRVEGGEAVIEAQAAGKAVTLRTDFGRQEEEVVDGVQKVVRKEEEKFKREIREVDLEEMHEDYYDVDALK